MSLRLAARARRSLVPLTVLSVTVPALAVVLPVVSAPVPAPHPVRTAVRAFALDRAAAPTSTASFDLVGARWSAGSLPAGSQVQFRARHGGQWTPWTALEPTDGGADAGSKDAEAAARTVGAGEIVSEPVWVGRSDAVQTRVSAVDGTAARRLPHTALTTAAAKVTLALVDGGSSAADASVGAPRVLGGGVASAAAAQPQIYSRAQWGADESLRLRTCPSGPDYGDTVKMGFVHHTDGTNDYAAADVPSIIRGIYAYHVQSNGWCDVGYNFLVDRFGRIWEGRWGGIDRPVIGAHTGGFNTDTFAASMIGNFQSLTPPSAMINAFQRLYAWKLGRYFRDPMGKTTLTAGAFSGSRYPVGAQVTFNTISGHRDADFTTCPGDAAYAMLGTIRQGARTYIAEGLVNPQLSAASAGYGSSGVTVQSGMLQPGTWSLVVRRACTGAVVRTLTGSGSSVAAAWNLVQSNGLPAPPGQYSLSLTPQSPSSTGATWTAPFTITGSAPPSSGDGGTGPTPTPAASRFVPIPPVRVLDTRTGTGTGGVVQPLGPKGTVAVQVAGVGGIPATGVTAVAMNLTGTCVTSDTHLAAYPGGSTYPGTSSVNLMPGDTRAGLVVVPLGVTGAVTVYNNDGSTDAVADVTGYYLATSGESYHPMQPTRVLDTRVSGGGGALGAGQVRTVSFAHVTGLPSSGVKAVVVNVTGVTGYPGTYLTVAPTISGRPATSSVNLNPGGVRANRVMSGLTDAETLQVYNYAGPTQVVVDLVGWYDDDPAGLPYTATEPTRVLDTRYGTGTNGATTPATAGSPVHLQVRGVAGVPDDAQAVVMTTTVTRPDATHYLTVWPGLTPRPRTSDVNYTAGQNVANLAVVPIGADGTVTLAPDGGTTHVVADVLGWYAPASAIGAAAR